MGCTQGNHGGVHCPEDVDTEEMRILRASIRKEDLQQLPEIQLKIRLKELGSKLELSKSELLEWVLFRNALLIIFGGDESKMGAALNTIRGLELDSESVVAALVALRPGDRKDPKEKDKYRKWAKQLEPDKARKLLRKTLFRMSLLRSARGFLLDGGNLMLQAVLREWRNMCICRMSLATVETPRYHEDTPRENEKVAGKHGITPIREADDTDADEGDRMLGEGRHEIFSRDTRCGVKPSNDAPIAGIALKDQNEVPDLPSLPQGREVSRASRASRVSSRGSLGELDATLNNMFDDEMFDNLSARLAQQDKESATPRLPQLPSNNRASDEMDTEVQCTETETGIQYLPGVYLGDHLNTDDIVLADEDVVPELPPSTVQKRDASRVSVDLDGELDKMFEDDRFDKLSARLSKKDRELLTPREPQTPPNNRAAGVVPELSLTPQKLQSSGNARSSNGEFAALDAEFDKMFEDKMFDGLSARLSKREKAVATPRGPHNLDGNGPPVQMKNLFSSF